MSIVLKMELITPERVVLAREAISVTVPGSEGDFGVLSGHAPFLSMVRSGEMLVESDDGTLQFAISGGVAEVLPERVTVLVDQAIAREDMDFTAITQAHQETAQRLGTLLETDVSYGPLTRRLAFQEACLEILNRKAPG